MSGLSINDMLTPALRERLARISDARPVLEAAGAALASVATRSFRDAALRPAEWPPLAASTLRRKQRHGGQPLIDRGALFRSVLAQDPGRDSVEVGTDREYSIYHQFGTGRMPARPFFPVAGGALTPRAEAEVRSAAERAIRALLE